MNFSQIVHFFNRNLHVSLGVLSGCGYHVYMHLEKKGLRIMPLREPLAQTTCTSTEDDVSASLKMPTPSARRRQLAGLCGTRARNVLPLPKRDRDCALASGCRRKLAFLSYWFIDHDACRQLPLLLYVHILITCFLSRL